MKFKSQAMENSIILMKLAELLQETGRLLALVEERRRHSLLQSMSKLVQGCSE